MTPFGLIRETSLPRDVVEAAAQRLKGSATPHQQRALVSHCGTTRFAYNWAVSWVRAAWDQRAAERSYGVPEQGLTPWRGWSLPAWRRQWNRVEHEVAPRWADNYKEACNSGLAGAAAAFDNYRASRNGSRAGARTGNRGGNARTPWACRAGSPPAPSGSSRSAGTSR